MPITVTSATQSIPEFATSLAPLKSGESFRENLQQAAEASHASAAAETTVRGKTARSREDGEKQPNPKQDERKQAHTEESAPAAVGLVAVQSPPSAAASQVLPRENAALTVAANSRATGPEATPVIATCDLSAFQLDVEPESGLAIAPDQGNKNSPVDAEGAKNKNHGVEADASAVDFAMPSQTVEDTSSAAAPPPKKTATQPATVNDAIADEHIAAAHMRRDEALITNAHNSEIAAKPGKPPDYGAGEVTTPTVDAIDKSLWQAPPAKRETGGGHSETAATSAEQFQKSAALSQVPLPSGDSNSGEGKTDSVHESGSADGRAPGHKNLDGGPVPRTMAHAEKNHDRTEPDPPTPNSGPAADSGHAQIRATQADGMGTALHASLTGDPAASARTTSRSDSDTNTKPTARSQEDATASGPAATEGHWPDGAALPVTVNTGRLVQRMQESEINLNVRSADFGNVAIHTAMSHERVSAQISLEHIDLGKAIASEVQTLQSKLSQEHGVQASIEVQQQGQSFSGNGGQQQQQAWRQQPAVAPMVRQEPSQTAMVPPEVLNDGRLDIRV